MSATDDGLMAETIGDWFLSDASGSLESSQVNVKVTPITGVPPSTAVFNDRSVIPIQISRKVILPSAFTSQEGTGKNLPKVYSGPGQEIDVSGMLPDPVGDITLIIQSDRLVKCDSRIGEFDQVRTYTWTSQWAKRGA